MSAPSIVVGKMLLLKGLQFVVDRGPTIGRGAQKLRMGVLEQKIGDFLKLATQPTASYLRIAKVSASISLMDRLKRPDAGS